MSESDIKTSSVSFLPYRIEGGEILVFLQKRTADAPSFPGDFLPFGGEIEAGEDPPAALMRELKEELGYAPVQEKYAGALEYPGHVVHVYLERVADGFEDSIHVMEGEYGKFFTEQEVYAEPKVPPDMKRVIPRFFDQIRAWDDSRTFQALK